MTKQLPLISVPERPRPVGPRPWVLDNQTREVGRRGLALARRALQQATVRSAA